MPLKKTQLQKLGLRAKGTAPKKYRVTGATKRSDYADPKRFKYPIHTRDNAKNALSRWGNPDNRRGYGLSDQRSIAKRIVRAARKFNIIVDPSTAMGRLAGLKRRR